eukprot:m.319175 g.319175  ORF g.319175 m.319175 type:complete len:231 (+) comp15990_c0_seq55:727-1419(+)
MPNRSRSNYIMTYASNNYCTRQVDLLALNDHDLVLSEMLLNNLEDFNRILTYVCRALLVPFDVDQCHASENLFCRAQPKQLAQVTELLSPCNGHQTNTVLLTGVVVGLANPEPFEAYTRDACSTCGSSFYATKGLSSRTSCCQQRITPKPPVFRTFQVCLLKLHESLFEPKQLRLQGDAVDAFVLGDEVSVVACVLSTGVMNDSSTPIGIPGMDEPRTLLVSSVEALNVG